MSKLTRDTIHKIIGRLEKELTNKESQYSITYLKNRVIYYKQQLIELQTRTYNKIRQDR